MKSRLRPWLRPLGILFLGLIFFFLFRELWVNWQELQQYSWRLNLSLALFSFFLLTLSLFLLPWGLKKVLALVGHSLPYGRICRILFTSMMAKYLPGGWWAFVGRTHFYCQEGLSLTQASLAVTIETILTISSGILVFVIFSQTPTEFSWNTPKSMLIFLGVFSLALLHPFFLNPLLSLFGRVFKKPVTSLTYSYHKMAYPFAVFFLFWLGMGGSFWCLCRSVVDVKLAQFAPMVSAFSLSWFIGFLSFLTPGGLGAREGALTLLLQPFFPLYAAAALALLSRVWWICGEILAWILTLCWERWVRAKNTPYGEEKGVQTTLAGRPGENESVKI